MVDRGWGLGDGAEEVLVGVGGERSFFELGEAERDEGRFFHKSTHELRYIFFNFLG